MKLVFLLQESLQRSVRARSTHVLCEIVVPNYNVASNGGIEGISGICCKVALSEFAIFSWLAFRGIHESGISDRYWKSALKSGFEDIVLVKLISFR